ncbi:hypothetical protein Y032_0479g2219 [Ancylostoma ceylanicum]|uniref:Uncharacterized protein n=1 Tax=Ancylostoma ceylanicum TaxID=53326 RepID=A0A016WX40_9BILA|nr:hypothetical protein Y032_0479g2219 [Ancylostoma ceylanicum]
MLTHEGRGEAYDEETARSAHSRIDEHLRALGNPTLFFYSLLYLYIATERLSSICICVDFSSSHVTSRRRSPSSRYTFPTPYADKGESPKIWAYDPRQSTTYWVGVFSPHG